MEFKIAVIACQLDKFYVHITGKSIISTFYMVIKKNHAALILIASALELVIT